ncbi:MAG: hypothetical protein JNM41_04290 [Flavipsychrobacter sp.]|nr:hypothetical protein [Flavipsychrobacter sp.]
MGKLPWHILDDKTFEELVRGLAKHSITHIDWDLYLKNGYKQEGIDIYGFDAISGKYACIQCKFYKEMDLPLLKKWITDFEDGKFLSTTNKFIIATTSDSQIKLLRDYYDTQVLRFNEYSIELKLWDVKNLEDKLKEHYGLVLHYFGVTVANDHCYSKNRHTIIKYQQVKDFINRKIVKVDDIENSDQFRFYFDKVSKVDINNIFLTDYVTTRRICLIADAYQGKSTILEQLAGVLSENDGYIPLFVRIKAHTLKPISDILDESYSYWKHYPTRELVIILDGLDEVARDKFEDYCKLIIEFTNSYPAINLIFSCRRLFCTHYRIYESATAFDFYEVCPITDEQIDDYINKLGRRKNQFKGYIAQNKLNELIYHPFYLVRLVDVYMNSTNAQVLPKSKIEILDFLIGESFKPASKRRLVGGSTLEEEKSNYISCIKRIALACQMMGVNALSIDQVGELFDERERGLLINSSFLTTTNSQWTFEITFFQENLAAMALIDMPYESILKVTTVGSIHRKIRMKWIQTIASFISLLDLKDERREKFLRLIENDNIELLTFCDASKFDAALRFNVLKQIIAKCIKSNSFPRPSSVEIIANFIKDSKEPILYLITSAENENSHIIKILCWKIIYNLAGLSGNERIVKDSAFEVLSNTSDGPLAGLMVNILSKFDLISLKEVSAITELEILLKETDFLNALFEMLIAKNIVDNFYSIGLDAIETFEKHQIKHSHYGAQNTLKRFLLCATTSKNIYLLLMHISVKKWSFVYGDSYLTDDKNQVLTELRDLAVKGYELDPLIFLPTSTILKYYLQRLYENKDFLLRSFLKMTNTSWLFFRFCKEKFPVHNLNQLAFIITPECFDYIFSEYEEGRISQQTLEDWYFWITYWKIGEDLASQYYDQLIAVTQSQFREIQEARISEHAELEKKKEENDLRVIQTSEAFKTGLKVFFQVYGKDSIPRGDTFVGYSQNTELRKVDSVFLSNFFLYFNTDVITIEQCLKYASNEEWFKYYQAKQILKYNFPSDEVKNVLLPILENYFIRVIRSENFTNSYIQDGKKTTWVKSHKLLKDIYEKHRFNVEGEHLVKLIWVITDGFNHLKSSIFDKSEAHILSKLLIENVEAELLVSTIVSNIKIGISSDSVLSSHLEFCRYLKISDVVNLILSPEIFDRFPNYQQTHLVEIFNELGGSKDELLGLFNTLKQRYNENNYVVKDLVIILSNDYPDEIRNSLEILLDDNTIVDAAKFEFASLLTSIGSLSGYAFIVNKIVNGTNNIERIQHSYSLDNIPTKFALNELGKIKKHILDDDLPFRSIEYSVKDFILNNLYAFAKRSEADLMLVEQFLSDIHDEFISHANSKAIIFHIERILEAFRDSIQSAFVVADVKLIFSQG